MKFECIATAGIWMAVVFAGCIDGGETSRAANATDPNAPTAQFDADRGAIEGIVTDEALTPIDQAAVTLVDAGLPAARTEANGRFAFSFLPPGEYLVLAEAEGFHLGRQTVSISAGTITSVSLRLASATSDEAFHVTSVLEGYVGCSVAVLVRPLNRYQPANVCGIPDLEDKYLVSAPVAGPDVRELFSIVFETTWRPTQVLGSGLFVRCSIEADAGSRVFNSPFWDMMGSSPVRMIINRTVVETMGAATPSFYEKCNPNAPCHFELAHYPWPNTLGPGYPVDVGANLEQRFTDYVTEFYQEPAPAEFSALPDR